jgi:hypothetical protein
MSYKTKSKDVEKGLKVSGLNGLRVSVPSVFKHNRRFRFVEPLNH